MKEATISASPLFRIKTVSYTIDDFAQAFRRNLFDPGNGNPIAGVFVEII